MKPSFLDTSILLRHILGEPNAYQKLKQFDKIYASELTRVEALRTIDRLRIQNRWPQEEVALRIRLLTAFSASVEIIPLQPAILRRASDPFPTTVGTLDALHIATALLIQIQLNKSLLFLTHDTRQGLAAVASGMDAEGFN
ncbi:MAG: type II toxin-antitoxin system VapC family toxin [Deltaproteobacteria bacterium]|nr:type II toxin-antitoxin system VapC family toxin [Deltaproteobacteria bacterium]